MMAFLEPATASTVRLIRSSRAGIKTYNLISILNEDERKTRPDLDPHIVRDLILFYQTAHEIKIRVASGRICDLNFLIPTFDEQRKESRFLFDSHGICKCLVPITQICRKPYWRYCRSFGGPLTVLKREWSGRFVPLGGVNARLSVSSCARMSSFDAQRKRSACNAGRGGETNSTS